MFIFMVSRKREFLSFAELIQRVIIGNSNVKLVNWRYGLKWHNITTILSTP